MKNKEEEEISKEEVEKTMKIIYDELGIDYKKEMEILENNEKYYKIMQMELFKEIFIKGYEYGINQFELCEDINEKFLEIFEDEKISFLRKKLHTLNLLMGSRSFDFGKMKGIGIAFLTNLHNEKEKNGKNEEGN